MVRLTVSLEKAINTFMLGAVASLLNRVERGWNRYFRKIYYFIRNHGYTRRRDELIAKLFVKEGLCRYFLIAFVT